MSSATRRLIFCDLGSQVCGGRKGPDSPLRGPERLRHKKQISVLAYISLRGPQRPTQPVRGAEEGTLCAQIAQFVGRKGGCVARS